MARVPRRGAIAAAIAAIVVITVAFPDERRAVVSGSGLAQGSLIAAVALGIVLTYRGAGVVNIANSAVAMYAAYTYALLRSDGDLFLPPLPNPFALIEGVVHRSRPDSRLDLPSWPTAISVADRVGFVPALAISLVACALLGLLMHVLVFRPLRAAPALAKVVASVGIFLLLQAIILRRFSSSPRSVAPLPFDGARRVNLGVLSISLGQLLVVAVVLACTVALSLVFRRTRFGLATRAAAENEAGAVVLGYSPDRLASCNWIISTMLTGLLGILVASISSNIDPIVVAALIVPALTAALVGGFSSFGVTTAAAFVLGMQLPLVQHWSVSASWFPRVEGLPIPGVETLAPVLVIVVLLYVRGQGLPGRGTEPSIRLPAATMPTRWALRTGGPLLVMVAAVAAVVLPPTLRIGLTNTLVGVMLCLSVVVVTGFVGQISLAPMAFAGIAAFSVAELSSARGWPFPLPIIVGAGLATAVGVATALPALRIRGVSLAIVTLALAVAADRFVFANALVNGGLGGAPVRTPSFIEQTDTTRYRLAGLTIGDGKQPNPRTALFCLLATVVVCYAVANLRRSPTGSQMLAVRSNERAAAAAGIDVARTKGLAFGLSAGIAGIGGSIMAYRQGGVHPEGFTFLQSMAVFAVAYLGGIARVSGAVVGGMLVAGGLLFTFLEEIAGVPSQFTLLLGGLGLIVTAVVHPDGVAGDIAKVGRWVRRAAPPVIATRTPSIEVRG